MPDNKWYIKNIEDIYKELKTTHTGLSTSDAESRIAEYGKNELVSGKKVSNIVKFLLQLKDVFMILLLVAAGISFSIGSYSDGTIMLIIVFVNAVIGFVQEFKAEKIVDSLKKLIQSPSKVIRDGDLKELHQEHLVPGDVIVLEEGDKVPADIRIIESFNMKTNDVSLTGESLPQNKHINTLKKDCPLGDRDNMAYLGTNVVSGNGKGIVTATGMNTEMGKIADMTQEQDKSVSPLQKELQAVANRLTFFAVIVAIFLFGGSIYLDFSLNVALIYAIGVAVAVVPQALPMQITVALYQGVNLLSKKNAVVKKLSAVETLGSTNVIATDKTGTLTKNEMTVTKVWFDGKEYEITGVGYEPKGSILDSEGKELTKDQIDEIEIMFDAATMASNAEIHEPDKDHANWYPIGDPTEAALITLSTKLGTRSPKEDEENPELHEFGFDSVRKRMSSVRQFGEDQVLTMKGALDSILEIAKFILKNGKEVPITDEDKNNLLKINEEYSKQALRVIAVAFRKLNRDMTDYVIENVERDVVFLGLTAMIDPPKEGVKEAIISAHEAHIDTIIMTGDHAITAQAIGKEIELSQTGEDVKVLTGAEMDEISDKELSRIMNENSSLIYSRVSPENKLRIVKLLKKQGKIVAVTGDGVNDAPALKSAHIGVAMGQMGTDVSKEAAELILLDDSFPTLVHAIREGRTIYYNLKKTVVASLTSNGAELAAVLMGLFGVSYFGWPIPIFAIQILAIDLLAEILPLTALTFDPGYKELMISPPRSRDEHIINKYSGLEIIFFGVLMGGLAFANFGYFINRMGIELVNNHELYYRATTITYMTIAVAQFVNILSRRYDRDT
ncbi:MAG: cation-translocating P-type ATPase, partial [Candidatus Delongbacteria bacterium]|nr:cation-translocating P-type ATPase [Candidatus Delongbacteria bacterium]MCG2760981.1 cation-translocating P-type ATPase [Candidatus Delongbacteria bacterium]